jgi:AcrR family transcriptional regulator
MTKRLTCQDWLAHALETLRRDGVAGLRVEPLARALGVTTGSFYWHFKDHGDLLRKLLDYWVTEHTDAAGLEMGRQSGDPRQRLLVLLRRIVRKDLNRYDSAMREWGRVDPRVARTVRRVDEERLAYVRQLFVEMGFDEAEADLRGRISYYYVLGEDVAGIDRGVKDRIAFLEARHRLLTDTGAGREAENLKASKPVRT